MTNHKLVDFTSTRPGDKTGDTDYAGMSNLDPIKLCWKFEDPNMCGSEVTKTWNGYFMSKWPLFKIVIFDQKSANIWK